MRYQLIYSSHSSLGLLSQLRRRLCGDLPGRYSLSDLSRRQVTALLGLARVQRVVDREDVGRVDRRLHALQHLSVQWAGHAGHVPLAELADAVVVRDAAAVGEDGVGALFSTSS